MRETEHSGRLLLICPAARREAANDALRELAGGEVFSAPLVGAGGAKDAPATHYAACWQVTAAEREALDAALAAVPGVAVQALGHWDAGRVGAEVEAGLGQRGLARREVETQAEATVSEVTDQWP